MSDSVLHSCQFCGKLVSYRYHRALCEKHSPLGEAMWVEFYGPSGWSEAQKCFVGFDADFCHIEHEPNGGFVCQECYGRLKEY